MYAASMGVELWGTIGHLDEKFPGSWPPSESWWKKVQPVQRDVNCTQVLLIVVVVVVVAAEPPSDTIPAR